MLGPLKKSVVMVTGFVLMTLIVLLGLKRNTDGPFYRGRTLARWTEKYYAATVFYPPDESGAKSAENAIRAIGSTAIPYLLEWINYEYELPEEAPMFRQVINDVQRVTRPKGTLEDPLLQRAEEATLAFRLIAKESRAVLPDLRKLFLGSSDDTSGRAGHILTAFGADAVPIFMDALTNENKSVRWRAANCLGGMRENARPAIPLLLQTLKQDDQTVSWMAAEALGRLHLEPSICVPALTIALMSTNERTKNSAASALGAFGTNANSAVPQLLKTIQPNDQYQNFPITNAVFRIAPVVYSNQIAK